MAQKNAQPVTATEHIPASEHGGGFPPFQKETFASQLLWLALVFVALYLLMSRIALPRIGSILEQRRQRIDGDLADAAELKESSDAAIAAYEKALADARGRAQTLANEAGRARIQAGLDEARRLREEAQALLELYRRKQQEAEREAADILAGAKAEADRLAVEAAAKMEEVLARRTKMAEAKIGQAETQALADVRAAAAEAAVAAAEVILKETVRGKLADDLLAKGIADLKGKLN